MRYLIGYEATCINKLAPALPTPAPSTSSGQDLRKEREPALVGDARECSKAWATRSGPVSPTPNFSPRAQPF